MTDSSYLAAAATAETTAVDSAVATGRLGGLLYHVTSPPSVVPLARRQGHTAAELAANSPVPMHHACLRRRRRRPK